jgi:hypothetical protein
VSTQKYGPPVLSGVSITNGTGPNAIGINSNTATIDTTAKIMIGDVMLTEELLSRMTAALDFVEQFARENAQANEVWVAIKTKRRLLK